jgi:hypothetical protein
VAPIVLEPEAIDGIDAVDVIEVARDASGRGEPRNAPAQAGRDDAGRRSMGTRNANRGARVRRTTRCAAPASDPGRASADDRRAARDLMRIPNVGPAVAADLMRLGIRSVDDLAGRDPHGMYKELCSLDGMRHDPCLWDTFMAVVDFARGGAPRPWHHFTPARKALQRESSPATGRGRSGSARPRMGAR